MNACIVTLIKTNNSGSYWQGRTLGIALEQLGFNVYYYDYNYLIKNRMAYYRAIPGIMLHEGIKQTVQYIKSLVSFHKLRKQLCFSKKTNAEDCIVLGSDTIWSLDNKMLNAKRDIFWGKVFSGKKIITYAGSVGNACEEQFAKWNDIEKVIDKWSAISVRDEHTKEIISKFTTKNIETVCDPTMLLSKEYYEKIIERKMETDYIFLYLFTDLSEEQSVQIKKYAKENKLKIIRGVNGVTMKSADYSTENSPMVFLQYMIYAKYVITDTFHGTIFSINLNKQFITMNRGKNKVNDALKMYNFYDRLVSKDEQLIDKLTTKIEYSEKMDRLNDVRKKSWQYLKESVM